MQPVSTKTALPRRSYRDPTDTLQARGWADGYINTHRRHWLMALLVQSFIDDKEYCSAEAQRLSQLEQLSPALLQVALHIDPSRQLWMAWQDMGSMRFLVAELDRTLRRTALHLSFHDIDGLLVASGSWTLDAACHWVLHTVDAAS